MFKMNVPQNSSALILGSPGVGILEFQMGMVKDYLEASYNFV